MQENNVSIDSLIKSTIESTLSKYLDEKLKRYNPNPEDQKEYLNTEETAKLLGIRPSTLYNLNLKREIPIYKVGKTNLYKRSDVITYIESHRISSLEEIEFQAQSLISKKRRK